MSRRPTVIALAAVIAGWRRWPSAAARGVRRRVAAAGFRRLLDRGEGAPAGARSLRQPRRVGRAPRAVGRRRALPPQPVPLSAARRPSCSGCWRSSPIAPRRSLFTGAAMRGLAATARLVARRAGRPRAATAVVLSRARCSSRSTSTSSAGRSICCCCCWCSWRLARRERAVGRRRGAGAGRRVQAGAARPAAGDRRARPLALGGGDARRRCAVAALAGVVIVGAGAVARVRADVLPRAALYGEGGTEEMLLPSATLPRRRTRTARPGSSRASLTKIALRAFDGPATRQPPAPAGARVAALGDQRAALPVRDRGAGLGGAAAGAARAPRRPTRRSSALLLFSAAAWRAS